MLKENNNTSIEVKQIPQDIADIKHFYGYDSFQVTCKDEYESAGIYFLQLSKHLKKAEEERKKIVDPINAGLKRVNQLFKNITDPLNKIKDSLEEKMGIFTKSERKRLEDEKRAELEIQKKAHEDAAKKARLDAIETGSEAALQVAQNFTKQADKIDLNNVEVSQTVRFGKEGTLSERRIWKWKVTNPILVPREFLAIDEKAINSFVKMNQDTRIIPGIEFYQETSFAALK